MSKKAMEDLQYNANKTQSGLYLNEFEQSFERYDILDYGIHKYWTSVFEKEQKLEL